MDKFILDSIKSGKSAQEVLDMPYQYLLELFAEQTKPKQTESLIAAFGG